MQEKPEKKKILYVVTKSNWGGAQRYVYDLAESFASEGFDIAVAFGGSGMLKEKLEAAGIKTISLPYWERDIAVWKELRAFFDILKIVRHEKPDILHLNSPKAGLLGALAGRIWRVPRIVYTAHGWPMGEERAFAAIMFFWLLSWLTVLLCHFTITVSEKDAGEMEKLPFIRGKVAAIHIGIALPAFRDKKAARAALKGELKTGRKTLWLGMIAEFTKNKGLRYALEAFQEISYFFPNAVLVLVGDGEERAALARQISQARLNERVGLPGFIENASELLPAFDLFLMSSIKEGLPYTLLEAGAAKLPVVSTGVGGIPEIVSHMRSGLLVPPRDPHALAVAVAALMKEIKHAGVLGNNLRTWVKKEFSLKRMLERTKTLAYRF